MGAPEIGTTIGGKYELLQPLGSGSMGALWLAKQGQRRVAIKFVLAPRDDFRERFDAEISALASLRSNYIVQVYDWGRVDDAPYMVMELLEGGDLADRVAKSPQRRFETTLAVDSVVEAAAGLAEAHAKGIVHRDLKPANLFFDRRTNSVKVVDFGIAGAGTGVRRALTEPGTYMGTPNYSAPEQFDGVAVDATADVWALGAILYELLSGRMAFPGDNIAPVMALVKTSQPAALTSLVPGLPAGLERVVERCLEKQPAARYPSVIVLIRALAPFGSSRSRAARDALDNTSAASEAELASTVAPIRLEEMPTTLMPTAATTPPDRRFYDREHLLQLLLAAPSDAKPIVFMLGAGFALPLKKGSNEGIPGTDEVVKELLEGLTEEEKVSLKPVLRVSTNRYQTAFDYINATRGKGEANSVIRRVVLKAFNGGGTLPADPALQEAACLSFEKQLGAWSMPPGVEHLGRIIAESQKDDRLARFSKIHLTTNFDPLLAIAIRRNGGKCETQAVETDYDIREADESCRLVYLHGRWRDGKTLHNDLDKPRPVLTQSLRRLLEGSTLVVLGYGGWTDVFMQTLTRAAEGEGRLDIRWGFFGKGADVKSEQPLLYKTLTGLGNQIEFYEEVNSNWLFAELEGQLLKAEPPPPPPPSPPPPPPIRPFPWQLALAIAGLATVGTLGGARITGCGGVGGIGGTGGEASANGGVATVQAGTGDVSPKGGAAAESAGGTLSPPIGGVTGAGGRASQGGSAGKGGGGGKSDEKKRGKGGEGAAGIGGAAATTAAAGTDAGGVTSVRSPECVTACALDCSNLGNNAKATCQADREKCQC